MNGSALGGARGRLTTLAVVVLALAALLAPRAAAAPEETSSSDAWLVAWAAPHIAQDDAKPFTQSAFHTQTVRNQTIRQMIEPGVAGTSIRVRLSNRFGASPVTIGAATLAVAAGRGPALVPGSARALSFDGARQVVLLPGETILSDPVYRSVTKGARFALDLHVLSAQGPYSGHSMAEAVSWVAPPLTGDLTGDLTGARLAVVGNAFEWVHSVDVMTAPRPVIVVLGDSSSTSHVAETDYVWPAKLAERLGTAAVVVNSAIVANNLTPSVLCSECNPSVSERITYDALDLPGVTDVVVLAGTNDITQLIPVEHLTEALSTLARTARAEGVTFTAATLLPRQDWYQYYDPEVMGPMRHALNWWIRTTEDIDAAFDFDAAIRDPLEPEQMWPPYDSGDRMHPGVLGMRKLAEVIDLSVFLSTSDSGRPSGKG